MVDFLSQLAASSSSLTPPWRPRRPGRAPWRKARCGRCSTASPRVYDLMNSVMTAGLHHRWRERAADLAAVGPGDRGARRRDRAPATSRSSWPRRVGPAGTVDRLRLLRGDARARARKVRRRCVGVGQRARAALRATTSSTPRPSASARATSPTSTAGSPRWRASCGPAAAWCPGDHHAAPPAALDVLLDLVRPDRARARAAGGRPGRLRLPARARSSASRRREALAARMARRGPDGRPLDPHRGRDHRPPRRDGRREQRRGGARPRRGRRRARAAR